MQKLSDIVRDDFAAIGAAKELGKQLISRNDLRTRINNVIYALDGHVYYVIGLFLRNRFRVPYDDCTYTDPGNKLQEQCFKATNPTLEDILSVIGGRYLDPTSRDHV